MHTDALKDTAILIIDDEADNVEFMRRVLEHFGAKVITAEDGNKALAALEHQPFALLLCDLSMPNLDGWEFFSQLRRDARFTEVPVIAVTAHALRADQQRAMAGGFAAYVVKPVIDVPAFLSLVTRTVSNG